MSKPKNTLAKAERAVQLAVEEQTREVRAELEAAHRRITALEGALRRISVDALAAAGQPTAPPKLPAGLGQSEAPVQEGPKVELAGSDNLGEGRWI